jgi:hypothetical protein
MRKKAGRVIAVGAMIIILGLGGGPVAFASLALGQSQRAPRHERRPVPYSEHSQYELVLACQRWCPADTLPCDPPSFKIADNRCGKPR